VRNHLKQQFAAIPERHRLTGLRINAQQSCSHVRRHEVLYGGILVVFVAVIAVALSAQGWRSRIPTFDLLTYVHSAHHLMATGALPRYGDTSSHGALSPPGTAWLILPSALLFGDLRLSEYVGAGLLYLVGLVGLFLLTRKYFGTWCACLAVVLYGLSSKGLFWAGSLWPIGRPEFFIWMVYLASEWVTRRRALYLAAAVAVAGVGMYVDMTILPAIFVLPALWLAYRPPVRLTSLLAAAALVLIVWYPYLRFEAPRRFIDIRSQLLFHSVLPADYKKTWCNPTLAIRSLPDRPAAGSTTPAQHVAASSSDSVVTPLGKYASDRLLSNFRGIAHVRGGGAVSAVLLLIVLTTLLWLTASRATPSPTEASESRRRRRTTAIAIGAIFSGLAAYGLARVAGGDPALHLPDLEGPGKLLVAGGATLLGAIHVSRFASGLFKRAAVALQDEERARSTWLLTLSLVIPWVIVIVMAEPGKAERYLWLWPLQVIFLAAFAANVLPLLRVPRSIVWIAQALLVFLLLGNHLLTSRVDAWRSSGWSGRNADEVRTVDYVADRLDAEGRSRASIGYRTFIYPFMANFNITNREYKVGADLDLLFKYGRDVVNSDTCAEGLSPKDEFRIVRATPMKGSEAPRSYVAAGPDTHFRLMRRFGPYEVLRRG
jgi:hypothetical protein